MTSHSRRACPESAGSVWLALMMAGLAAGLPQWFGTSAQGDDLRPLFGQVTDADWERLGAGQVLDQSPVVTGIVLQTGNIPPRMFRNFSSPLTEPGPAVGAPARYSGHAVVMSGRIAEMPVRYRDPNPENLAEAADGSGAPIWQLVVVDEIGSRITVLSGQMPPVWRNGDPAGQPVVVRGVFLGLHGESPVVAVPRVEWYPEKPDAGLGVTESQVRLARAGLDTSRLADLRHFSDAAILPEELEVFGSILRAAARIDANGPAAGTGSARLPALDLVATVRNAADRAGEAYWVAGQLRRITRVPVRDPSFRELAGADRYYQLDVFVPIPNQTILLEPRGGGKPVSIEGSYGATLLLHRLPPGLETAELPVTIEAPAWFFKVWEHKSIATRSASPDLRRPNPVFVGLPGGLVIRTGTEAARGLSTAIPVFWAAIAVLVVLLVAWSWRGRPRGRRFRSPPGFAEGPGERGPRGPGF